MGGASGETEEKEVFTDEPEIEEEKEQPATTAGVPEVENGFSDGENVCGLVDNGTAAENINQGQKHTVHIKNVEPFPIERQTIVDIINNHDGTVTIGVDPDVYIGDQKDTGKYKVMYYQTSVGIGTDGKNPESNDTQQMFPNNQYLYVTSAYMNEQKYEKAKQIMEKRFGKPGLRRQYADAFSFVENSCKQEIPTL